jgi:hypothetical protein
MVLVWQQDKHAQATDCNGVYRVAGHLVRHTEVPAWFIVFQATNATHTISFAGAWSFMHTGNLA